MARSRSVGWLLQAASTQAGRKVSATSQASAQRARLSGSARLEWPGPRLFRGQRFADDAPMPDIPAAAAVDRRDQALRADAVDLQRLPRAVNPAHEGAG